MGEVVEDTMGLIVDLLEEVSASANTLCFKPHAEAPLRLTMTSTDSKIGPVTDYTSSMVQWMRHRQPRYKGGGRIEMERPSPSYAVDVCSSAKTQAPTDLPLC